MNKWRRWLTLTRWPRCRLSTIVSRKGKSHKMQWCQHWLWFGPHYTFDGLTMWKHYDLIEIKQCQSTCHTEQWLCTYQLSNRLRQSNKYITKRGNHFWDAENKTSLNSITYCRFCICARFKLSMNNYEYGEMYDLCSVDDRVWVRVRFMT